MKFVPSGDLRHISVEVILLNYVSIYGRQTSNDVVVMKTDQAMFINEIDRKTTLVVDDNNSLFP